MKKRGAIYRPCPGSTNVAFPQATDNKVITARDFSIPEREFLFANSLADFSDEIQYKAVTNSGAIYSAFTSQELVGAILSQTSVNIDPAHWPRVTIFESQERGVSDRLCHGKDRILKFVSTYQTPVDLRYCPPTRAHLTRAGPVLTISKSSSPRMRAISQHSTLKERWCADAAICA